MSAEGPAEKLLPCHTYRSARDKQSYDPRRCAAPVFGERVTHWQCSRAPRLEYGGHKWCAQHYPPNVEKRQQERRDEWRRESDERTKRRDSEDAERRQKDAALEAIKQIAAGHNDPQSLAREVLAKGRPA